MPIQRRKTEHFTASANDAFATIRITARDCGEGVCEEALSYLCLLYTSKGGRMREYETKQNDQAAARGD